MKMGVIELPGEQEEVLGTAEDLREEVVLEMTQPEISGSMVHIEFETSIGFCRGTYTCSELGHEEINLDEESQNILKLLFTAFNGAFVHQANRDWVEVSLSEHLTGFPEYKIYMRKVIS